MQFLKRSSKIPKGYAQRSFLTLTILNKEKIYIETLSQKIPVRSTYYINDQKKVIFPNDRLIVTRFRELDEQGTPISDWALTNTDNNWVSDKGIELSFQKQSVNGVEKLLFELVNNIKDGYAASTI